MLLPERGRRDPAKRGNRRQTNMLRPAKGPRQRRRPHRRATTPDEFSIVRVPPFGLGGEGETVAPEEGQHSDSPLLRAFLERREQLVLFLAVTIAVR